MTKVSVVLPTYNEAQTIKQVVASLRGNLKRHADSHEIIVVDDDSPDDTADKVRSVWHQTDAVQVIVREDKSGLASAVVRGFEAASGDVWAVMDADGQHDPGQLPALTMHVADSDADVAVGSRRCETGRVVADWPAWRRLISHGATALAWLAIPQARSLSDPMSGFFAVDSRLVDPSDLDPCGYKILLEILGRCPIEESDEVGYTFRERDGGESNLDAREYLRYLRHLGKLVVPSRRRSVGRPFDAPAVEVDD